jgi:hypothetical protein
VGKWGHTKSRGLKLFIRRSKGKTSIGNRIFVHHRILSAVKRVRFVSDRMRYIVLRGRWCNIILINVNATSEEKSEDSKESFVRNYEERFNLEVRKEYQTGITNRSASLGNLSDDEDINRAWENIRENIKTSDK